MSRLGINLVMLSMILHLLLSGFRFSQNQEPAFRFLTKDSVEVEVFGMFDAENTIEGYSARVFTPICEDSVCYAVELDFYWDVLGNFKEYGLVPGMPLTKQEHEPFTEEDYEKLAVILSDKQPSFASMSKEDLIIEVVNETIDGITGATVAAIQDEIVPGAAYSCYTLWHIAHGTVMDSIQENTKRRLDANLVSELASLKDEDAHFFLLNSFEEKDFRTYLPQVLDLIRRNGNYFDKETIELIPEKMLLEKELQEFFAMEFAGFAYFAQRSLLERLDNKFISADLAEVLIQNLDDRGSFQNEAIIRLICYNSGKLEIETTRQFLQQIIQTGLELSLDEYEKVVSLDQKNELLKKDIQTFKKNYKKRQKRK